MQLRREFPGEDGQAFIEILKGGHLATGIVEPVPENKQALSSSALLIVIVVLPMSN